MAYVAVLMLLVLMTVMGMAFLLKAHTESMVALKRLDNMKAHYLAEAAANHALWRVLNKDLPANDDRYYMHALGDGRYGYKITGAAASRPTTATVATVGAVAGADARQSYVAYFPKVPPNPKRILFVTSDASSLNAQDTVKKALFESWGFVVSLISEDASQEEFDDAAAQADVVFVSEEADPADVGDKLAAATIGGTTADQDSKLSSGAG